MNIINLTGNVGQDIEARQSNSGLSYVRFSIAISRKVKDETKTSWVRCVAFGDLAANLDGTAKGTRLMVEGRLDESVYTDKEGVERKSLELILDDAGVSQRFAKRDGGSSYSAAEPF